MSSWPDFLALLAEAIRRRGVHVHAYVLMDNHVHLVATSPQPLALSWAIQDVGRIYVPYFNKRYGRTGTLWEGRYHSTVIQAERYLMACHRYVDLNPVRAALAASPAEYTWSSHRYYASGRADDLVTPHPLLQSLGRTPSEAQRSYARLFEHALDEAVIEQIRRCTRGAWALGDPQFCAQVSGSIRRAVPFQRGWRPRRARCSRGMEPQTGFRPDQEEGQVMARSCAPA